MKARDAASWLTLVLGAVTVIVGAIRSDTAVLVVGAGLLGGPAVAASQGDKGD